MERLIPMTEFVLKETESLQNNNYYELYKDVDSLRKIKKYAEFLKQPLTLGMFVPTDENNNVLKEPTQEKYGWYSACFPEEESGWVYEEGEAKYYEALKQWEKAKERVLFKGFSLVKNIDGFGDAEFYLMRNGSLQVYGDIIKGEFRMRFPKMFAKTIEELINQYQLFELTPSAKKQINGN